MLSSLAHYHPHREEDDAAAAVSWCSSEQTVNCCCCHYDPFDDDSPETRIKDLSFALRKLSVMKCQMRKWRLERLELESQVRALTKSLRANGVNVDAVLKVDPLVTHLRAEYQKLDNRKAALEDEVRDLRETIKERECFEKEPCKAVIYAREKILEIRARCAAEKRQLRETMGNLQLKLEETSARLTNEVDQQQVSKKSIGELCAQLKKENKRLLAEVETLKKCMKMDSSKTAEMSELCERMRVCECEVTQMRCQLAERDAIIQDLEKRLQAQRRNSTQLEKVAVSQRALGDQNVAMKAKQKQKEEKYSSQLDAMKVELEKARASNRNLEQTLEKLGSESATLRDSKERLETELKEIRQRLEQSSSELQCAKEDGTRLKVELDDLRNQVTKSQDEFKKITTERDELTRQICAIKEKAREEVEASKKELDACRCKLDEMRRKLDESKRTIESAEARNSELQCSLDACTSANGKLTTELEHAKAELCKLGKQLDDTMRLRDELKAIKCEVDRLKTANAGAQAENLCLKKDNESLKKSVEMLERAKETLAADLVNAKIEMQSEKQRLAAEVRRQSTDAENELKSCRSENKRLKCAINESKRKAQTEIACASKALKEEIQAQIEAVNCVTELMNYAEGKVTRRPETSTRTIGDRSDKWTAPEIIELFDNLRILSEEISKAEEVAKNLEPRTTDKLAVETDEEITSIVSELEETKSSMETREKTQRATKSNATRRVFPCAISPYMLTPEKQLVEREHVTPFDPASWLRSLSLTELAELHEQICAITSNIVSEDAGNLQRQIAERQREVTVRATETRLALLKEQTRLARIADEMNRESGFALHISVDARIPSTSSSDRPMLCCRRDDCLRVGCAVDFDPNRSRRK